RVRWSSDRGRFGTAASYVAPARNARIVATAGGARAEATLLVGRHRSALALSDRPSLPLAYDFTSGARAAYAPMNDVPLPGEPQSFTVEIEGDRSGVGVRAAFVNVLGERRALTLARAVDWGGWRAVTIPLPDDLNPPVHLVSLYAVDTLANAPSHAAGTLAFRNASTIVAGTP
ncbi:MAG: hypothetical protein IAI48_04680, partial [Candidatus Eremiobacteraeota bacterium]|nr:hypothetical protein [Candidatus Eremiobacteraeota bacterium]